MARRGRGRRPFETALGRSRERRCALRRPLQWKRADTVRGRGRARRTPGKRNVIEPKWTRALGEELRRWRKEDVAPASVATRVVHSSDVLAAGGDLRVERWLERDDEDVGEAIALAQSHTQALLDLIGDRLAPLSTGELERALKRLQARLHAIDD